ncbi:MAG: hypothetical protein GF401_11505 [Chitinivibrionales bacterium]|nr:hypothetical protein [Chitinivibrionales bacterium]
MGSITVFCNRRKYKRHKIKCDIKVRMMGKVVEGADCMNISLGGMCIRIPHLPEEGPTGRVWITRKYKKDRIEFESDFRKIWSRPADISSDETMIGIIFGEMPPVQRDNLWKILQQEERGG